MGPATPGAVVSYLPYNSGCLVFRGGPYAGDGIYVSNILVSHCNLHANTDLLTIIGVQHAIFEYCNFYDCEFDSSPVSNHPNLDMQAFSGDIHFRYCRFWDWVSEGIMLGAATEPSPHPWGPTYFMAAFLKVLTMAPMQPEWSRPGGISKRCTSTTTPA